jgi:hypothetical protein
MSGLHNACVILHSMIAILKDSCSNLHNAVLEIHSSLGTRIQLATHTRPLYVVQCSSDNMPSPLSRFEPDASSRSRLVLPILLFLASLVANVGTPTKHSLLTSALAWLAVCALCTVKTGAKNLLHVTPAKKNTWAAGLLFALAQVCDKAVDGRAIWWAKVRRRHSGGLG